MRIWKLIVLLAVPVILWRDVAADDDCQPYLDKAAEAHLARAGKALEKFNRKLDAKLSAAIAGKAAESASTLSRSVRRIVDRRDPDGARRAYVQDVAAMMRDPATLVASGVACDDRNTIRDTFNANFETFQAILDQIEVDVDERLDIEKLGRNEGLLVLAFNTNSMLHHVMINRADSITGAITFGPIRAGEHFRVVRAKAGDYFWQEAMQRVLVFNSSVMRDVESKRTADLRQDEHRFTVVPGKLNYAGVFLYETIPGGYYNASIYDRLTIVLTALEQRYPELLEQYEFANGLFPDDRFTEYYLAEKRALRLGDRLAD